MRLAKVIERSFVVFPIFLLRFSFSIRLLFFFFGPLLRAETPLPLRTLVTIEQALLFAGALTSVSIGRGYRWPMPRCFLSQIINPFRFVTVRQATQGKLQSI